MEFKKLIAKLDTYGKIIHRAVIVLGIVEALLALAIGYVTNNLNSDGKESNMFLTIFIVLAIIYIPLLILRIVYTNSFPIEIANELKSERELTECKRNAVRQEKISEFFIKSMKKLNGGTCALNNSFETLNLCEIGIRDGVKELVSDLIDNIGYVLDSVNTNDYTVGFYHKYYNKTQTNQDKTKSVVSDYGTFILKDGLNKKESLSKEIVAENYFKGEELSIHSILIKSVNDNKFVHEHYPVENKKYSIIAAPITEACDKDEKYGAGVFFIISNHLDTIPKDIENNLKIFNRIIANYIFRYNECVYSKCEEYNRTFVEV